MERESIQTVGRHLNLRMNEPAARLARTALLPDAVRRAIKNLGVGNERQGAYAQAFVGALKRGEPFSTAHTQARQAANPTGAEPRQPGLEKLGELLRRKI